MTLPIPWSTTLPLLSSTEVTASTLGKTSSPILYKGPCKGSDRYDKYNIFHTNQPMRSFSAPVSITVYGWCILRPPDIPTDTAFFNILILLVGVPSKSFTLTSGCNGISISPPKVTARYRGLTKASEQKYSSSEIASLISTLLLVKPTLMNLVTRWLFLTSFFDFFLDGLFELYLEPLP